LVTIRKILWPDGPIKAGQDIEKFYWSCISLADWWTPDREHVVAIGLDTQNQIIFYWLVSIGTINETMFHCREILRTAIVANCHKFVLVHNHPSNILTPSAADIEVTHDLIKASNLVRIPVIDHIIVGNQSGTCFSIREAGLCSFIIKSAAQEIAS